MPLRAESVGSLIRPAEIARQMDAIYDAVDGVGSPPERPVVAHRDGEQHAYIGEPIPVGRIHKRRNPLVEEATVLRQVSGGVPFKLTVPAASVLLWQAAYSTPPAYDSPWEMANDALDVTREMVAEAVAAGTPYIQVDLVPYATFDETGQWSASMLQDTLGADADELLEKAIEFDRAVVEGLPDDVILATHICRGNDFPGGKGFLLDHVAERMFAEVPHERWLIEWYEPERHGDFSALRFVPPGKVVVLGLVDTKTPQLESEDEIVRKIEDAARHIPIDQLALSPQCGFSSAVGFEQVGGEEMQWRKLELVRRVADRVWGHG